MIKINIEYLPAITYSLINNRIAVCQSIEIQNESTEDEITSENVIEESIADEIIDLGPDGGDMGGNIVVQGTPEQVSLCQSSYTGQYLISKLKK